MLLHNCSISFRFQSFFLSFRFHFYTNFSDFITSFFAPLFYTSTVRLFKMADGEDELQLPRLGDIAQDLPALDDENGFEPVSPGILLIDGSRSFIKLEVSIDYDSRHRPTATNVELNLKLFKKFFLIGFCIRISTTT